MDRVEAAARAIVAAQFETEGLGELTDERWADMLADWHRLEREMPGIHWSEHRAAKALLFADAALEAIAPPGDAVERALAAELPDGKGCVRDWIGDKWVEPEAVMRAALEAAGPGGDPPHFFKAEFQDTPPKREGMLGEVVFHRSGRACWLCRASGKWEFLEDLPPRPRNASPPIGSDQASDACPGCYGISLRHTCGKPHDALAGRASPVPESEARACTSDDVSERVDQPDLLAEAVEARRIMELVSEHTHDHTLPWRQEIAQLRDRVTVLERLLSPDPAGTCITMEVPEDWKHRLVEDLRPHLELVIREALRSELFTDEGGSGKESCT